MNREELYRIAADAVNDEELRGADIPAIDLYVDQIINLVSDKLKSGSERYHDRQLTKTMINNYSKDGLITPVKGKKYNKEQITQILTVYSLKHSLSIGEIKRLLDGSYAKEGFDGDSLIRLYDRYMEVKDENRAYAKEIMDQLMVRDGLDVEDDEGFMLLVCSMLSLSVFLRHTAQAMIDVKYPPAVESEEEKKDKDKEKEEKKEKDKSKKEKEEKKEKNKEKKKKGEEEITEETPQ